MKKLISLVCTASIMASILAPVASAINLSNEAQTVRYSTVFGVSGDFLDLATDLLKSISTMANNAQYKTLYFHEVIKGHKTLPSMWQQVKCKYYVDSAHKKFACNDTFYRAWG